MGIIIKEKQKMSVRFYVCSITFDRPCRRSICLMSVVNMSLSFVMSVVCSNYASAFVKA